MYTNAYEMRYVMRNGERVLQQRMSYEYKPYGVRDTKVYQRWEDVPIRSEEPNEPVPDWLRQQMPKIE